jgi:hypothetical protein
VCKARKRIKRRVENVRSSPAENEQKAMSLMLRKHLINLVEVVTERKSLRVCREWDLSRRLRA